MIPGGMPLLCDFCGDSVEFDDSWVHRCDTFTLTAPIFDADGKHVGEEPWTSDEDWAACRTCHELIEGNEKEKLFERSWRKNRPRWERQSRKRDALVKDGLVRLHAAFWDRRSGEARHVAPTPKRQRMLMTETMLRLFGEKLRTDEALVTRAMEPLWVPQLAQKREVEAGFLALLRTSAVYLLDDGQAEDALGSMPPGLSELPPLPFARLSVELTVINRTAGVRVPVPWMDASAEHATTGERYDQNVRIPLLGLSEIEPGVEWVVYLPYFIVDQELVAALKQGGRESFGCAAARLIVEEGKIKVEMPVLSPTGVEMAGFETEEEADEMYHESSQVIARNAINAAHLITAQKVPTHHVPLQRPQRREMARRYKWREGQVYFIDLHAAGSRETRDGDGTREYHCRWMVAGHWRQLPTGALRDGGRVWKGQRTWVKAHVRGPAGAPWKGRAVHDGADE